MEVLSGFTACICRALGWLRMFLLRGIFLVPLPGLLGQWYFGSAANKDLWKPFNIGSSLKAHATTGLCACNGHIKICEKPIGLASWPLLDCLEASALLILWDGALDKGWMKAPRTYSQDRKLAVT